MGILLGILIIMLLLALIGLLTLLNYVRYLEKQNWDEVEYEEGEYDRERIE